MLATAIHHNVCLTTSLNRAPGHTIQVETRVLSPVPPCDVTSHDLCRAVTSKVALRDSSVKSHGRARDLLGT